MDPGARARELLADVERESGDDLDVDRKIALARAYAQLAVAEQLAARPRTGGDPVLGDRTADPDEAVW
jgi:hypothetical protein